MQGFFRIFPTYSDNLDVGNYAFGRKYAATISKNEFFGINFGDKCCFLAWLDVCIYVIGQNNTSSHSKFKMWR